MMYALVTFALVCGAALAFGIAALRAWSKAWEPRV